MDVWINPSLIAGDERTIFLLDKPGNLWPIRLQLNRDDTMVFNARVQGISGTKFMASITSDVPLDTWSHVALRFSGADSKVDAFLNGVLEGSANTDKELLADIDDVIIGCYTNMGTDHFVGILDEMRVHNKALTDAEIEQNYNATGLAVAKDAKLSVTWGSVKI